MSYLGELRDFFRYGYERRGRWGFAIYRTVYTIESETLFPIAVQRLDRYLKEGFKNYGTPENRKEEEAQLLSQIKQQNVNNEVLDNKEKFENATFDELRAHFEEWIEGKDEENRWFGAGARVFIVVDQEALESIVGAPEEPYLPLEDDIVEFSRYFTKVVDRDYSVGPYPMPPEGYHGWVRASLFDLWLLYQYMDEESLKLYDN